MLPQEIIRRKRDRGELSSEEIVAFAAGLTDGGFSEGQVAAFAMAVFLNGMSRAEAVALTLAMRDSGHVLDWSELDGPVTDKHSTGGVGDNVSLMLAPLVAACGAYVPMISGRGLGHTGGTLDKMDAVPGYVTQPDEKRFRQAVRAAGCAIIGQTADLAPADKRFYAIRDVTGTVESIPLITASILSKKLAAGLGSLVLDVKAGDGAFMSSTRRARELAETLVDVARGAGLAASALLTDMDQPLADAAGNALEVRHAVAFLDGSRRERRMEEVVLALAAEMLMASGLAATPHEATSRVRDALDSGAAAERFARMVATLGGPKEFMEKVDRHLPEAKLHHDIVARESGYVGAIATREIGLAVVELGGGRRHAADEIDPAVGLTAILPVGTRVEKGDVLACVHASSEKAAEGAVPRVAAAIRIDETKPRARKPVLRRVVPSGRR